MSNTASNVWADSAYRSKEIEKKLAERGLKSRIHRRAYRNRQLSEAQQAAEQNALEGARPRRACVRRPEDRHGAGIVRTIGIVRARCKIVMTNLAYNIRRFIYLERMKAATA